MRCWRTGSPEEPVDELAAPVKGTAGEFAERLEQKVTAWVDKYVWGDINELDKEKGLSADEWQEVIKEAKFYCAQAPLDLLQHVLPGSVYQQLPKLLAHAIINKKLWRIIEHPFYFLKSEYTPAFFMPISQTPPEGFTAYLRELLKTAALCKYR